jgi:hypothetical protein
MTTPELQPLHLCDLSPLEHRLATLTHAGQRLLVVAFSGRYRPGSAGNPDARHMSAVVAAALVGWDFDGVVLDLRELDYVWGDALLGVFRATPPGGAVALAWAVVISERSAAVRSLLGDALVCDDFAAAVGCAARRAGEIARHDAACEAATLVVAVDAGLATDEAMRCTAAITLRAGLAADERDDMRSFSSGAHALRVERVPPAVLGTPRRALVAAGSGAIAYLELRE